MELPIIWIRPEFVGGELKGTLMVRETDNVDRNGMVWGIEGLRGLRLVEIIVNLQSIFGYQLPIVSAAVASNVILNNNNNNSYNANTPQSYVDNYQEQQEYLAGSPASHRERSHSPFLDSYNSASSYNSNNYSNNNSASHTSGHSGNTVNTLASSAANTATYQTSQTLSHIDDREKLKKKVVEEVDRKLKGFEGEFEKFNEIKRKLIEGESVLNRENMTLNNEINLLNKEIDILESKRTEMERFITSNSNEISQRSATTPADPASSQLLELLANESALMDTLYQLIKVTVTPANGASRVPLNTSLRCIRELSRKHFLTKAHIRKIINK